MSKISLDPEIEQSAIKRSKKDKKAFGVLYKHYKEHIYRYVYMKVSNDVVAEDITSNVFRKALEGIDNFKWQGVPFSSWLYRIARNTVIDFYRSESKRSKEESIHERTVYSTEKTPEEHALHTEFEEHIQELLLDLNENERQIIYMKFFEGYTNKTIADLLELSESNVGTIIHRGMTRLRKKLILD